MCKEFFSSDLTEVIPSIERISENSVFRDRFLELKKKCMEDNAKT